MKKLMTMIATVAMAFGLYAAGTVSNSVNFASYTGEFDPVNKDDTGAVLASGGDIYWSFTKADLDTAAAIKDGALAIESGSDTLSRNFAAKANTSGLTGAVQPVDNTEGLFVDAKFIFKEALTDVPNASEYANAKLAAFILDTTDYVEGTGTAPSTNLWVVGGYWTGSSIAPRAYKMQVYKDNGAEETIDAEFLTSQKRLTIKAYKNVVQGGTTASGFLVRVGNKFATALGYVDFDSETGAFDLANYVDDSTHQTPEYLGNVTLDPSVGFRYTNRQLILTADNADTGKFTSVDFKGRTTLCNVALTDTVPADIAQDFIDLQTLTITKGAGIASINVTGATLSTGDAYTFAPGASVTVTATYETETGYAYKAGKWTLNTKEVDGSNGYTWTPADNDNLVVAGFKAVAKAYDAQGQEIGSGYETIAEALAATGVAKVGLTADVTLGTTVLNIEAAKTITLDLAGKTISGSGSLLGVSAVIDNSGTLTIIDSLGTGKIAPAEGVTAIQNESGSTLTIEAGTYDGDVVNAGECAVEPVITATAGSFKKSDAMTKAAVEAFVDLATYEVVETGDYWTVQEIQKSNIKDAVVTASATYGDEAPAVIVTLNGQVIDPANYDISSAYTSATAAGTVITVTVTAKGDTYTGTASGNFIVAKKALTVSVSLNVTEATFDAEKTTPGAYATPTITGLDGVDAGEYTAAWDKTDVTAKGGTFIYSVEAKEGGNYTFAKASATLTVKAQRPEVITGGSEAQKSAYDEWVKNTAGSVTDPTAAANIDRFIMKVPATTDDAALKAIAETELNTLITENDALTKLIAGETVDLTALKAKYPNATIKFVEVSEGGLQATANSKFWRLKFSFTPANVK